MTKKYRMYFLVLSLCIFSCSVYAQESPKFDDNWKHCEANPECIVIRGACDEPECVNKRFSEKASQYYEDIESSVDCHFSGSDQKATAVCTDNECQCQDLRKVKEDGDKTS